MITYCCKDCGDLIERHTALYKGGRCRSCSQTGKFVSKISCLKMSEAKKGKKRSEETCLKISKSSKGKRHSEESRLKMSKVKKGKHHSEETKIKMSKARRGKKHYNYIDGLSRSPYCRRFNEKLKQKIRKRDNYLCRICNKTSKRNLSVHHIDYNKENCKENNLISLCCKCHIQTNYNRDYWFVYCTYLMENR